MITVKKGLRLLGIALLCACLTACGASDYSPSEGELERLTSALSEEEPPSAYRLIVPSDCSAELLREAYRSASAIAEKTEIPAYVTYEDEATATSAKEAWILIGRLSFAVSRELAKPLRRDDYFCRVAQSGHLVICGGSDSAVVVALTRFRDEILPAATPSSLLHAGGGFSFEGSYDVGTVTLNGFDLREYCIVYAEDAAAQARTVAYALRERISLLGGYCLDVCSERELNGTGRAIILRVEENERNAYWAPTGNGISLCAAERLGLSVAARDFCELLLRETEPSTYACTVSAKQAVLYDASPYTVSSLAIEHLLPFSSAKDVTDVTDLLWTRDPDGILLSPMDKKQADYIRQSMSAYEAVETEKDGRSATGLSSEGIVMTLTSSYELAESGLLVMNYRVTGGGSAFRLVCIQGELNASREISLSELSAGFEEPTVIVAHWQTSAGELTFTNEEEAGLCAAANERFSVSETRYGFACYFDASFLSVEIDYADNGLGYRELSVRPVSVL